MSSSQDRRIAGIVVAAGRAERFGGAGPKQFERLDALTVVERAVRSLTEHPSVAAVVAVFPSDAIGGPHDEAVRAIAGVVDVVAGGSTRADSVLNGLGSVRAYPFVLVHDAARPLVGAHVVDAVVTAMLEDGAAVPVVPIHDTVRRDDGTGYSEGTLDRERLRLAQTPQGARTSWLIEALEAARKDGIAVTDEAAALERAGRRVRLVMGDPANVKITTIEDLVRARVQLERWNAVPRVGTGFDIHRFGGDGALVLGGVLFPGEPGLLGHSDADVVLHAAMDAILGAAALPDIGTHFPPGDVKWRGAASSDLARRVLALVHEAGFAVTSLDMTVLAERPRIAARVPEMRAATAAAFGLHADQVGIKATTLETLGALGRGEGIACQATAVVVRHRDPGP